MAHDELLVTYLLVPALDDLVAPWRHPGSLSAHVTLWPPWHQPSGTDGIAQRLELAASRTASWIARFAPPVWLSARVVALQPVEPAPFAELLASLGAPPVPSAARERPYRPHVTVATRWPRARLLDAADAATRASPRDAPIALLALARRDLALRTWREECRWPLAPRSSDHP